MPIDNFFWKLIFLSFNNLKINPELIITEYNTYATYNELIE